MAEDNFKAKFRKALKDVGEAIKDAASLDVVTMTGKIDVTVDTAFTGDKFEVTNFYKHLFEEGGKLKAGMQVVAISHVDIDNDRFNFVETDADPGMVKLHNDAVAASQEARAAFLEFLKGFVTGE